MIFNIVNMYCVYQTLSYPNNEEYKFKMCASHSITSSFNDLRMLLAALKLSNAFSRIANNFSLYAWRVPKENLSKQLF